MMHRSRTRTSRPLSAPDPTSTLPWYNNRINRRRSESAVPPLPASQVFSIPPSRPGRTLRKSSIDHHPSTSYGDPINYKVEGSTGLLFQNVKGLTHTTTHEDYKYYMQPGWKGGPRAAPILVECFLCKLYCTVGLT